MVFDAAVLWGAGYERSIAPTRPVYVRCRQHPILAHSSGSPRPKSKSASGSKQHQQAPAAWTGSPGGSKSSTAVKTEQAPPQLNSTTQLSKHHLNTCSTLRLLESVLSLGGNQLAWWFPADAGYALGLERPRDPLQCQSPLRERGAFRALSMRGDPPIPQPIHPMRPEDTALFVLFVGAYSTPLQFGWMPLETNRFSYFKGRQAIRGRIGMRPSR
jgi:hypothetical protein